VEFRAHTASSQTWCRWANQAIAPGLELQNRVGQENLSQSRGCETFQANFAGRDGVLAVPNNIVNSSEPTLPNAKGPAPLDEFGQQTGLPWFPTWRSVYLFVLGSFVLWLSLLYLLSVLYP
jgi:hypothetical protein